MHCPTHHVRAVSEIGSFWSGGLAHLLASEWVSRWAVRGNVRRRTSRASSQSEHTAMVRAALGGQMDAVRLLLDRGADFEATADVSLHWHAQ